MAGLTKPPPGLVPLTRELPDNLDVLAVLLGLMTAGADQAADQSPPTVGIAGLDVGDPTVVVFEESVNDQFKMFYALFFKHLAPKNLQHEATCRWF